MRRLKPSHFYTLPHRKAPAYLGMRALFTMTDASKLRRYSKMPIAVSSQQLRYIRYTAMAISVQQTVIAA